MLIASKSGKSDLNSTSISNIEDINDNGENDSDGYNEKRTDEGTHVGNEVIKGSNIVTINIALGNIFDKEEYSCLFDKSLVITEIEIEAKFISIITMPNITNNDNINNYNIGRFNKGDIIEKSVPQSLNKIIDIENGFIFCLCDESDLKFSPSNITTAFFGGIKYRLERTSDTSNDIIVVAKDKSKDSSSNIAQQMTDDEITPSNTNVNNTGINSLPILDNQFENNNFDYSENGKDYKAHDSKKVRGIKTGEVNDAKDNNISDLTVSIVTWNMAELSPSEQDASFLKKFCCKPSITRQTREKNRLNFF